jgi:N-acetylmuramoyl-L-alanine amidase
MAVFGKFLRFVQAVHDAEIEFPHLKIAIIAQAMLESGRGSSMLFENNNNPFGMHYHDFLKEYAVPVQYATKTEEAGVGVFCYFYSYETAIMAYFKWFDHWTHYGNWRKAAGKTAADFLAHIGPHYCPAGYTKEWMSKHGGMKYHEYIIHELYEEAERLLIQLPKQIPTKKVGLNAGHAGSAGAEGKNPSIREEFFTDLQTKEIKRLLNKNTHSLIAI